MKIREVERLLAAANTPQVVADDLSRRGIIARSPVLRGRPGCPYWDRKQKRNRRPFPGGSADRRAERRAAAHGGCGTVRQCFAMITMSAPERRRLPNRGPCETAEIG
jgi:hypothetical protein